MIMWCESQGRFKDKETKIELLEMNHMIFEMKTALVGVADDWYCERLANLELATEAMQSVHLPEEQTVVAVTLKMSGD